MRLTEDVRGLSLALDHWIEEGDTLRERYANMTKHLSHRAAEARVMALLKEDDAAVRAEMARAMTYEMSPEDRELMVQMLTWTQDFFAWGRHLTSYDTRYERTRRQVQDLRTELMVIMTQDLPRTQEAYYMGLATTLGEELKYLKEKHEALKEKASESPSPR